MKNPRRATGGGFFTVPEGGRGGIPRLLHSVMLFRFFPKKQPHDLQHTLGDGQLDFPEFRWEFPQGTRCGEMDHPYPDECNQGIPKA